MRAATDRGIVSATLYVNKVLIEKGRDYVVKNNTLDTIYEKIKKRLDNDAVKANAS